MSGFYNTTFHVCNHCNHCDLPLEPDVVRWLRKLRAGFRPIGLISFTGGQPTGTYTDTRSHFLFVNQCQCVEVRHGSDIEIR